VEGDVLPYSFIQSRPLLRVNTAVRHFSQNGNKDFAVENVYPAVKKVSM